MNLYRIEEKHRGVVCLEQDLETIKREVFTYHGQELLMYSDFEETDLTVECVCHYGPGAGSATFYKHKEVAWMQYEIKFLKNKLQRIKEVVQC